MFSAPRAIGHTYYLPSRDRIVGPAAVELGDLLRHVWTVHRGDAPIERSDGVSVWLDQEGCVCAAVVRAREVESVTEIDVLREALRGLEVIPLLTRRVA